MKDLYPTRTSNLAARVIGGEAIVLNPADSTFFDLNETATAIWTAADGRATFGEIAARLAAEYDVDRETALQDAAELVSALASHGIMGVSEGPLS